MLIIRSIHVAANGWFHSFYGGVIFHCVYVPQPLYLFLCWWTFWLLPCLGYLNSGAVSQSGSVSSKDPIPPASARDVRDASLIPGSGRSPGGGHGNPLQYYCLENPMDRGAWWGTVHSVTQSQTWLKQLSMRAVNHKMHFSNYCFLRIYTQEWDCWIIWGWQRLKWLDSVTDLMNVSLSKLWETAESRSLACCSPWGCKDDWATKQW